MRIPVIHQDYLVPQSVRVDLKVTGEILGPDLIENLDHLLQVPYGCGEQNMVSLTPNV